MITSDSSIWMSPSSISGDKSPFLPRLGCNDTPFLPLALFQLLILLAYYDKVLAKDNMAFYRV